MNRKEITHMALQIEKLHKDGNYEDISHLLADISNTTVTLEHLQTTDIAKSIYQLVKSCPAGSVRKRAKDVLAKWKRLHCLLHEHNNVKARSQTSEECKAIGQGETEVDKQELGQNENDNEAAIGFNIEESNVESSVSSSAFSKAQTVPQEGHSRTTLTVPPLITDAPNSTVLREKCVQLLIQSLNPDQTDPELTTQLAQTIETHIDSLHGQNPRKYKSCIRSKVANLKNPKNPHLRQGLLSGVLAPEAFARMSAQEMAGDELRQLRHGYTTAGISEHQLPQGPEGTVTTKVRCQRCEGMDCRVTQVSRGTLFLPSWVKRNGVDEEAMTFMTCASCGAQWYHSRWVCL